MNNFICDLNDFKFIQLTGEKTAPFLQGQLTCDIREVTEQQSRLAAHCNRKGKVQAIMRVMQLNGHFYLELPNSLLDSTLQHLLSIALLSRVRLTSAELISLGCYGEELSHSLQQMLIPTECTKIRISDIRFEVIGPPDTIETIRSTLKQQFPLLSEDYWQWLDIKAGIPWIYPETQNLFTPHMLDLPKLAAVSFKKGCYVGQEVIARTHYLGKTKRQLQKITITSPDLPAPGTQWEDGIVINAAVNPITRQGTALIVV